MTDPLGARLKTIADQIGAEIDDDASITICHGPPRCDGNGGEPCPFCYVLFADDPRDTDEIMKDMRAEH